MFSNYSSQINGMVAGNGVIYATEQYWVSSFDSQGTRQSIAGNGLAGFTNGVGTHAQVNSPMGIALDSNGRVYFADYLNMRIRAVSSLGMIESNFLNTG